MGQVKRMLFEEQEHDARMRDMEPDFDDYAKAVQSEIFNAELIKTLFRITGTSTISDLITTIRSYQDIIVTLKEKAFETGKYCDGCENNLITDDPFNTGDSPTMRECTANDPTECPGLY